MAECLAGFDHLDEAPTNLRKIVEWDFSLSRKRILLLNKRSVSIVRLGDGSMLYHLDFILA